jgi:hypothetical protein
LPEVPFSRGPPALFLACIFRAHCSGSRFVGGLAWRLFRRHGLFAAGVIAVLSVSSVMIALVRLGCADRDAVGLKPGKDRCADVLGGSLKPGGCRSIDRPRQFSWAQHRQPGIVFGSHDYDLTDWLSLRNYFVPVRTLIHSKDAVLQSAERRCDLDHQKGCEM